MSSSILCNISDAENITTEERNVWVKNVLAALGVDQETIDNAKFDAYCQKMEEFGIEVIFCTSGRLDIYKKSWFELGETCGWLPAKEENLVAQWKPPTRVMHTEGKETYYELILNEWSILNMR